MSNVGVEIIKCDQVYSEIVEDYILFMKKEKEIADTTINTRISHIRAYFYFCFEKGYMPYFKISLMKIQKPIKQAYTDNEVEILLKKPDMSVTTFEEYRNWLVEVFLYDTGVRIKTLVNILIQDLLFDRNKILIRVQKNRKITYIHMSPLLKEYLQEYLTYRKGNPDDYLFCQANGKTISRDGMRSAIRIYNGRKSISKTSPHLFRHKHSLDFMEEGGNIAELQFNLGHSSVKTTELYLQELGVDVNRSNNGVSLLENKLKQKINTRLPSAELIKIRQ